MYRPKQETLLQKFNRTDPFKLLNKRNMQKGNTPFIIQMNMSLTDNKVHF